LNRAIALSDVFVAILNAVVIEKDELSRLFALIRFLNRPEKGGVPIEISL
jgi:hypothetical protein